MFPSSIRSPAPPLDLSGEIFKEAARGNYTRGCWQCWDHGYNLEYPLVKILLKKQ
jgi:hypothetical protein